MNILKYCAIKQDTSTADELGEILDAINWDPDTRALINYPDCDENSSKHWNNYKNERSGSNGTYLSLSLRALHPAARSQFGEEPVAVIASTSPRCAVTNQGRTFAVFASEAKQSPEDSHVVWRLLRRWHSSQ
jgi:hypothetical protein